MRFGHRNSLFPLSLATGKSKLARNRAGMWIQSGERRKKPWMRWFGAALAHSLQQGLILGHGGGQSRLRSHQEGEGSWQEPVQLSLRSGGGWMCSPRQGRVLHLSGAVVTLPEEGPISSGPFSCRRGTAGKRSREGNPGGVLPPLLFPHVVQLTKPSFIGVFCLLWRASEQPKAVREVNKGKPYLPIPSQPPSR